jgi:toxin ParE1/3/4
MPGIGRGIMQDSPVRAGTFVDELYERCGSLGQMPRAFPLIPGYEDKGVRRRVHGDYLIFYRIGDSGIEVLRVLHGAQDYERVLFGDR